MKCKRKKRGNGQLDKYKSRGAARGDQLAALYRKLGIEPPESYSPTSVLSKEQRSYTHKIRTTHSETLIQEEHSTSKNTRE